MKLLKSLVLSIILLLGTPMFSAASDPVFAPLPVTTTQIVSNQAKCQAALDAYWLGHQSSVTSAPTAPAIALPPKQKSNAPASVTPVVPAPVVAPASSATQAATSQQPNVTVLVVPSESKGNALTRVVDATGSFVKNHIGIDIAIILSALLLAGVIEWKRIFTWVRTLIKIFTTPKPAPAKPASPTVPVVVTSTTVTSAIPAGNTGSATPVSGSV